MHQNGYIGRKMRTPQLQKKPAIIIAAFGTSSRAKTPLALFQQGVEQRFPDHELFWAYTSDIICRKLKLPTIKETLAQVEAAGYRRAVVQPLQIFPGTEYTQLAETCEYFPGLRVVLSETLFHRWEFILDGLDVLEQDFLPADKGLNILALHGTSLTADPVNSAYLGFAELVADRYPNVIAASIEGVPHHKAVFSRLERENCVERYPLAQIIPIMYFSGIHADNDLMGKEQSWRTTLENMGFKVRCPMIEVDGNAFYKGLAHQAKLLEAFMERIQRSLNLTELF